MGQINSTRNQGPTVVVDRPASLDVPSRSSPPALVASRPSIARGGHRKSLRNRVVGLIRPRPSRDVEDGVAHVATESKKWWRRLHRQSNVQPVRQGAISAAGGVARGSLSDGLESSVSPAQPPLHAINDERESTSEPPESEVHTSTPVSSSKGKERALETPSSAINNSSEETPSTLGSGNVSREASSPNTINSSTVPDSTAYPHLEVVDGNGEAATSMPDQPASQPTANPDFMNMFPPAGTLVVVQGVVHPENASSSIHGSPPSPLRPANRPSRSNSIAQHMADSLRYEQARQEASGTSPPWHAASDLSGSEDPGTSASEGSATLASRDTTDSAWRSEPSVNTHLGSGPRGDSQQESASSPNGADVLGTLLRIVSVATAATAASLLSGPNGRSTRPFAPTGLSDMPATAASPERPAFSALARALASTSSSAPAVLSQREQEREERERTRSRSIWEGLRDRVSNSRGSRTVAEGDQHSLSSPFSAGNDRTNDGVSAPDTLFSELARAFSLGLPSDGRPSQAHTSSFSRPSSEQQQSSSPDGEEPQDRVADNVPPDSFEQFLVDLLSDLRVALSRNDNASTAVSERRRDENIQGEDVGSSSGTGDANSAEHISRPHDNAEPSLSDSTHLSSRGTVPEDLGLHTVDNHAMRPTSSTLPNGPSRANFTSADRSLSSSEHPRQINNGSRLEETDTSVSPPSTMRPSDFDAPASRNRTNWWRMYQFPPMLPAQVTQNNAGLHQSGSEQAPILLTSRTNVTASTDFSDPTDSASRENANMVIPVILVGLQSISTGSRPSPLWASATEHAGVNERGRERMDTGTTGTTGSRGSAAHPSVPGSWPSRAARAFGRMGRRDEVGTAGPGPSGDARTFFIYVFGGHYPPNHHILSGSDVFENFETLWEMADFLGQVKPPVVTQEEIERSGLVIFKASSLGEYESARRVANNCVDRCLICLDDYVPDDDLRLLSCKHAFHKACVDQWLKVGRNSCPACRGEGVRTDNGPTAPSL